MGYKLSAIVHTYMVFNATEFLIDAFVELIREGYRHTRGGYKSNYEEIIGWAGNAALENIANSDAPDHNVEHTIMVTLVGQETLQGKHIHSGGVSCEDSLHYIMSPVCHNIIGYVKGCVVAIEKIALLPDAEPW